MYTLSTQHHRKSGMTKVAIFLWFPLLMVQTGCSSVAYYAQAIDGHFEIMNARQSITDLIDAPDTDEELRKKLVLLRDARVYATTKLDLPNNKSYSSYADTGRDYVTWNVVASPEFSLQAKSWCFPVAGCVTYRGYFAEEKAQKYASELSTQGFDAIVGGATAYSTLGWFEDPLLNTMIKGGDLRLIGVLFHELAHQKLYVKDDSSFNEAFASFVEQAGVRQWLKDKDEADRVAAYDAYLQRQIDFGELLSSTRAELVDLYKSEFSETQMRTEKAAVFTKMQENYQLLKESWNGYSGYDGWFKREINNARLISVATYRKWVPAFAALYEEEGSQFTAFYDAARKLAALPRQARDKKLQSYLQ